MAKQSRGCRPKPTSFTVPSRMLCIILLQLSCVSASTEQTIVRNPLAKEKLTRENQIAHNEISTLRNKCTSAESDLDKCSAQLIALGQSKALYPMDMEELNSVYCPNFKSTISCIKNSTDCYKPFEKQIIK